MRLTSCVIGAATGLTFALALIPAAAASPIVFTARDPIATPAGAHPNSDAAAAAFAAALSGSTVIDFENLAVGAGNPIDPAPGVSVSFNNIENNTVRTGGSVTLGFNTTPGGSKYIPVDSANTGIPTTTVFSFLTPINAFGAYFTGAGSTDGGLSLIFNDGSLETLNVELANAFPSGTGSVRFFGFTDFGTAISSITVRVGTVGGSSDDIVGVDDVRFSSVAAAAVPEPGSAWLLATAVSLCLSSQWVMARRSKKRR